MKKILYEINSGLRFEHSKNLDFTFHMHEDIELIYCIKGSANAFCDNKEYTIKQGDFFLVFPNQVHSYSKSDTSGDYFKIILHPKKLGEYSSVFSNAVPKNALYHYNSSNTQDKIILPMLLSAWRDYKQNETFSIVMSQITVVLGKLLNCYSMEKSPSNDTTISKIVQYCNKNYSEMISINDICEHLNISRSCVSHLFHDKLSIGFCDYINALRLNDAEYLLRSTNDSVTAIALNSGFYTVRTFNRVFFKKHGISPTAYRNKCLNLMINSAGVPTKEDRIF